MLKDFIANPDKNFGFLVKNTFLSMELDFPSSEYERPEWRPKLTIEYKGSNVGLTQKRVRLNGMQSPVKLSLINRELHVDNSIANPVVVTLTRLDGTTIASKTVPGGARKTFSAQSAGVYVISVSGNNFIVHEKLSLFQ